MKYFQFILILLLLISCDEDSNDIEDGNKNITTEQIELSNIKGISVKGNGNIIIAKGEINLQLQTDENLQDNLVAKVKKDGILEVYLEDANPSTRVNYFITLPNFEYISISGSGFVIADTLFTEDYLEVDISGDGDLRFDNLQIDELEIDVRGTADFRAAGSCDKLNLNIKGTGEASLLDFLVSKAFIDISGVGNVKINVADSLNVNIKGSGKVDYKGNPEKDIQISGVGSVNQIKE